MDIVKHNDKYNVVTLYTRRRGRVPFLVPVGKSKSGRLRNALLMPMAVVSADVNFREGKELYSLRQVQPVRLWHGIYAHPVKSALLMFLTEFCSRLTRQYPADEKLWEFIVGALEEMEARPAERLANFHIAFLVRLLPLAGIEPTVGGYEKGDRFDMLSAEMMAEGHLPFTRRVALLSEEESGVVPTLLRIDYRNMHLFNFSKVGRRDTLQRLLQYYAVHLPIGTDYKTLPVLRELFDTP